MNLRMSQKEEFALVDALREEIPKGTTHTTVPWTLMDVVRETKRIVVWSFSDVGVNVGGSDQLHFLEWDAALEDTAVFPLKREQVVRAVQKLDKTHPELAEDFRREVLYYLAA